MPTGIIAILLSVTALLILVMLLALLAIWVQGRRIDRIARETLDLARQVEAHPAEPAGDEPKPPQGG